MPIYKLTRKEIRYTDYFVEAQTAEGARAIYENCTPHERRQLLQHPVADEDTFDAVDDQIEVATADEVTRAAPLIVPPVADSEVIAQQVLGPVSASQVATMLAALQHWQEVVRETELGEARIQHIPLNLQLHFLLEPPLSHAEIDALCERLQRCR